MSLDFKKRDYITDPPHKGATKPGVAKESALSLLLGKSKEATESDVEDGSDSFGGSNGARPALSVNTSPNSPLRGGDENRNTPQTPTFGTRLPVPVAGSNRSSSIPVSADCTTASSVRIPSSSYRKSSYIQSSLQQERDRARTGDFSMHNTPNSSILGTSAGYGHLFGAGEIGNVSSPRHYSIPITKEAFDPGSVEERFVVNLPLTAASNNDSASVTTVSRSLSKASLSRSSSRSSVSSLTSLRRFMEKPWKNDDPGASSNVTPQSPGTPSIRSRKGSISSFQTGDEDSYSTNGSVNSFNPGSVGSSSSMGSASLSQLDQQYAANQNSQSTNGIRRRQSLKAFGKLGKTLGEGAGGHVKIIKSSHDNQIYAVKEFRARHSSESVRDYNKKVGAEYCLGLTLKHPNIVNTIDIIYETDKVYQVMEYAAFDLFAIVMSGKMSREEVMCDFRQLMNGIRYLHGSGLAHRDLKLDNCVVSDQGIVKIIDFGSSVVFRYPESDKIYDCDGVVGSDPYLAPEAAGKGRYVPPSTDIWSAAIVLCCMLMRKFPWKAPRMSDPAFKSFVSVESDGSRPGLNKLLSSLPTESHDLFKGMLDLNPETRFTVERCWENPFLCEESFCTIKGKDEHVPAPGHNHTIVSFEEAHIALLEKKNRKAKKGEKMW